ncbi:hypothetical protein N7451_005477 [Penicillium sp. IBT 35674x]|nr:hypothetical protein N7451_005477 [Penicillium sp. IBT 35674x]
MTSIPFKETDRKLQYLYKPSITFEDSQTAKSLRHLKIPVFISHGSDDPKVSARLGEKMSHVLPTGLGLGHWYRPEDEVEDILNFLQTQLNLSVEPRPSSSH